MPLSADSRIINRPPDRSTHRLLWSHCVTNTSNLKPIEPLEVMTNSKGCKGQRTTVSTTTGLQSTQSYNLKGHVPSTGAPKSRGMKKNMEGKCADSERLKRPVTQLRHRYLLGSGLDKINWKHFGENCRKLHTDWAFDNTKEWPLIF